MSTVLPPPPVLESPLSPPPPRPPRGSRRQVWLWFFLVASVLLNIWFFGASELRNQMIARQNKDVFVERFLTGNEDADSKIAVIRVEGLISKEIDGRMGVDGMVGDIRKQFELVEKDDAVKAVILRVDSPGGEILAADEIYRLVRKMRGRKPVIASLGSVAASGGYYVALGSKWIIAEELTITGSIGVIMETLNYKDLLGKIGLRMVVFKSGKFKDLMNGSRDPLPGEEAVLQDLVDEAYRQFVGVVAQERKLDAEELKKESADGRIFSGRRALAAHLIDATGTFEDAIKKAREEAKIPDAKVFDYVVPFSLRNLLALFAKSPPTHIQVDLPKPCAGLKTGKLYYLSAHLL